MGREEEALCLWLVRKILKCSIYCSHCDGAFCEMQFVAIDLDQLVLTCTFDMWNGGKHSHEMAYKSKKLNFMMGKNLEPNLVVCSALSSNL